MADTAAGSEPGPPLPRRASWRSGLGCAATVLSVAALVVVGQLAGTLVRHRPGTDPPAPGPAPGLAQRLDALPPAVQAVPPTDAGVAALLAGVGLPVSTAVDVQFRPGYAVIAIGVVGDCVFADLHQRRVRAWEAPKLMPCTADRAFHSLFGGQGRWPDLDRRDRLSQSR
ncbi:hypothetical protein [Streptacidiphilus sp. P02-A3a]|uniref:hypothetical protein n=1 Tax=Streptacidiphilus sp. P02-A3a TaxID=2704468 RepID=UPI0015F9EE2C|nr:hypothetical protein [Streptacidiphilus sp. P02-A3a]QMU68726.1 hypothetical protein GXP74_11280 [Streptacidiphilus sp. P02-A3a]